MRSIQLGGLVPDPPQPEQPTNRLAGQGARARRRAKAQLYGGPAGGGKTEKLHVSVGGVDISNHVQISFEDTDGGIFMKDYAKAQEIADKYLQFSLPPLELELLPPSHPNCRSVPILQGHDPENTALDAQLSVIDAKVGKPFTGTLSGFFDSSALENLKAAIVNAKPKPLPQVFAEPEIVSVSRTLSCGVTHGVYSVGFKIQDGTTRYIFVTALDETQARRMARGKLEATLR